MQPDFVEVDMPVAKVCADVGKLFPNFRLAQGQGATNDVADPNRVA